MCKNCDCNKTTVRFNKGIEETDKINIEAGENTFADIGGFIVKRDIVERNVENCKEKGMLLDYIKMSISRFNIKEVINKCGFENTLVGTSHNKINVNESKMSNTVTCQICFAVTDAEDKFIYPAQLILIADNFDFDEDNDRVEIGKSTTVKFKATPMQQARVVNYN